VGRTRIASLLVIAALGCRRGGGGGAGGTSASAAPEESAAPRPNSIGGLCHGGWCFEDPLPTGEELIDVVSGGRDDAIIATAGGGALGSSLIRWDGVAFRAHDVNEHVTALHRAGPKEVWATTREGVLLRGDGVTWTAIDFGGKSALTSIWGAGADAIWAVGDDGVIVRWDGAAWTRAASPVKERLRIVRGRARDDVWAGGDGVILHYDGKSWSVAHRVTEGPRKQTVPTGGFCGTPALMAKEHNEALTRVGALAVLGEDNVIAAAGVGRMLRYDGKTWSEEDLTSRGVRGVSALFAIGKTTYAVGTGALAHFDGAKWSVDERPDHERLNAVHGADEKNVWIVGALGTMLRGSRDKFMRVGGFGSCAPLHSMFVGEHEVIAASEGDALLRRRPKGWERLASPAGKQTFRAIGGASDTDVWAFVAFGPALHWDGKKWSEAPRAPAFAPFRVRAAAADDVWALDPLEASRWDGKTWRRDDGKLQLLDVWAPSRGKAWATARARGADGMPIFGEDTLLVRWDGAKWSKLATIAGSASGIGGVAPDDLWIATMSEVLHYDGKTLTSVHKNASGADSIGERVVIARAPTDVTVAGYGHAVHYDGHAWKTEDAPLPNAVFAGGPSGVFAFGPTGGIAKRK